MKKIFLILTAAFLLTATGAMAQKVPAGDYYADYGTVTVKPSSTAKTLDFAITIETQKGCTGEFEGAAKMVRKNYFVMEKPLVEDFGPGAKYMFEFTVAGNKITVKESAPGANKDVVIWRGKNCTFSGVYKK